MKRTVKAVFRRLIPPMLAAGLLAAVLISLSGEWLIARKIVATLIVPIGAVWIVWFAMLWAKGWPRWLRLLAIFGWCFYTLAGNTYVGVGLMRHLEAPFYDYEILEGDLDALIVLGGGTQRTPRQRAALGAHGDRVILPARLYLAERVGALIPTGRSITEMGTDRILSDEAEQIWVDLGIPREAIYQITEPRNTAEELAAVSELLKEHPDWNRIGLCTSAWHLERALKEADRVGLDLVPVPANFRSTGGGWSSLYVIPQGSGMRDVATASWEILGRLL
ncbi:MAG: YdcF family protein [Verrucomicrobiota bacterium]